MPKSLQPKVQGAEHSVFSRGRGTAPLGCCRAFRCLATSLFPQPCTPGFPLVPGGASSVPPGLGTARGPVQVPSSGCSPAATSMARGWGRDSLHWHKRASPGFHNSKATAEEFRMVLAPEGEVNKGQETRRWRNRLLARLFHSHTPKLCLTGSVGRGKGLFYSTRESLLHLFQPCSISSAIYFVL